MNLQTRLLEVVCFTVQKTNGGNHVSDTIFGNVILLRREAVVKLVRQLRTYKIL